MTSVTPTHMHPVKPCFTVITTGPIFNILGHLFIRSTTHTTTNTILSTSTGCAAGISGLQLGSCTFSLLLSCPFSPPGFSSISSSSLSISLYFMKVVKPFLHFRCWKEHFLCNDCQFILSRFLTFELKNC